MKYLGNYAACEPWAAVGMQCDDCDVSWTGCWDNFQCPKCGKGELPWRASEDSDELPGYHRVRNMEKDDIQLHPRECDPVACNDRECPYSHYDSWSFNGEYYDTPAEAEAARAALTSG